MSSFKSSKYPKDIPEPDYAVYNRRELMRRQEIGLQIDIEPQTNTIQPLGNGKRPYAPYSSQSVPTAINNQPVVAITNLNINADDEVTESKDEEAQKAEQEKEQLDAYEPKEDVKRIEMRNQHNWFILKFADCDEFYQFLDQFSIFGLLAEEDGCLIITHYDDLVADKKYRTVKFNGFDRWMRADLECKRDDYKKYYSDAKSIKKKGACTKNEKTIGIRHRYIWLQLTFRYEWEFEKFLADSKCYGLTNQYSGEVVRKFQDLEKSDYRLFAMPTWDSYDMKDLDGKYTGNVVERVPKPKGMFLLKLAD